MKEITALLLIFISLKSFSCDNCNVYLGITPGDNKHSIGLYFRSRYMMGSYSIFGQQTMTKHAGHGNDPQLWGNEVHEIYRTIELRGRFLFKERFTTYIIMPIVDNIQLVNDNTRFKLNGIGDPTLIQSIQVLDPYKNYGTTEFTQRLEIGGGLKFPFGKTDQTVEGYTPNLDLQTGTGSWDVIGMLRYILKIKGFGVMFNSSYKWNTTNKNDYKYGNTLNSNLNLFYQTKWNNFTFMPVVGMYIEHAAHDFSTTEHFDTGGQALFVNGGISVFWKKVRLFGEYQKTVFNNLNGYSQLINKFRFNVGITYNF